MNLIKTMSELLKPETKSGSPARQSNDRAHYLVPRVNIVAAPNGYVLEADLPSVAKSGLEVTVEHDQLTITGRRSAYESTGVLLHGESRPLAFRRTFELDASIDRARIRAKLDQGVLTLHLPKAAAVQPRKVAVTD